MKSMIRQFIYIILYSIANCTICYIIMKILDFSLTIPLILFAIIILAAPSIVITIAVFKIFGISLKEKSDQKLYLIYFIIYFAISSNIIAYESHFAPLYFFRGLQYHAIQNDFIKLQKAQKDFYEKNGYFANKFGELEWKKWEMSRCNYFMGGDSLFSDVNLGNQHIEIPKNVPKYLDTYSNNEEYRIIIICKWNLNGHYDIWSISPKSIDQIIDQWSHKYDREDNKPLYYLFKLPFSKGYK